MLGDRDFVTAEDIEQLQYMEQVCILDSLAIIILFISCTSKLVSGFVSTVNDCNTN